MYFFVIFLGFQVSDDLCRCGQSCGQAFLNLGGDPVCLSEIRFARE